MKKWISIILTLCIIFVSFTSVIDATSTENQKEETIKSISDSLNETETFTINYPAYVAKVDINSLVLSGKGTIVKNSIKVNESTREITFTVKGEKKNSASITVYGYSNSGKEWFLSTPGNAFCRYSDGKDWQINTIKTTDFTQDQLRYTNSTDKVPTNVPYTLLRVLATSTTQKISVEKGYWFDESGNSVQRSVVNPSTVKVPKNDSKNTYVKPLKGVEGSIFFPKNYDSSSPKFGIEYKAKAKTLSDLSDIPTNNPAFLTGHAACYMYPTNLEYYMTAQTYPSTTYDYSGTISYKFTGYTEAMLDGILTVDPTSTRYEDKDVIVTLNVEGEVFNLEDPGALDYYKIYLKDGEGKLLVDDSGVIIKANSKTTVKHSQAYTISKDKIKNVTDYTEKFSARIYACYKPSSYYVDSKNGKCMDSGLKQASTYVYKQAAPTPPPVNRESPVAIIKADSEVMLGDDTYISGLDSYDPDGTIERYSWLTYDAKDAIEGNVDGGWTWYDKLGDHKVKLCVVDNDGLSNCTIHSLVVTEPTIKALIKQTGTLKQNRKVTFTSSSQTPSRYPELTEKTTWTITPIAGGTSTDIKIDGSLKGTRSIDVLFKQPGEYKVTVSVENAAGYKDSVSYVYTISPDESPYVDFEFQQKVYRDPTDGNQATFKLTDLSYSFDGDSIVSRKWYVVYDANNDGNFGEAKVLISSGNETYVEYKTKKVGKYAFYLEVQEEFGQPTIEKFVTASDRKKSNTWD